MPVGVSVSEDNCPLPPGFVRALLHVLHENKIMDEPPSAELVASVFGVGDIWTLLANPALRLESRYVDGPFRLCVQLCSVSPGLARGMGWMLLSA